MNQVVLGENQGCQRGNKIVVFVKVLVAFFFVLWRVRGFGGSRCMLLLFCLLESLKTQRDVVIMGIEFVLFIT